MKPELGHEVQYSRATTAIVYSQPHQDVIGTLFGVFDFAIKVIVLVENFGI
jgi:hypothetical protein